MSMTIILCPPEVDVEETLRKPWLGRGVKVERAGSQEELEQLLNRQVRSGVFEMMTKEGRAFLRVEEIVRVRAEGHLFHVLLRDGEEIHSLTTRCTFAENVASLLAQDGFLLCRRNILVNLRYAASMHGTRLRMKSGEEITIARGHRDKVYQGLNEMGA